MAQNLKANDKVRIIAGNHKGTEAKIVKIDRKNGKAMIEGVGVIERHMRKSYTNPTGGKKTIHVGIDLSNLKLVEAAKFVKSSVKKLDKSASKKDAKVKKGAK
jgi:large subunit ribosomal protein L24